MNATKNNIGKISLPEEKNNKMHWQLGDFAKWLQRPKQRTKYGKTNRNPYRQQCFQWFSKVSFSSKTGRNANRTGF
jgi:hypothetical protein